VANTPASPAPNKTANGLAAEQINPQHMNDEEVSNTDIIIKVTGDSDCLLFRISRRMFLHKMMILQHRRPPNQVRICIADEYTQISSTVNLSLSFVDETLQPLWRI